VNRRPTKETKLLSNENGRPDELKSVFEHGGWPNTQQSAELIGYVANAVTITVPVWAGLGYTWALPGWQILLFILLALFGGAGTFWSWKIVYLAVLGGAKVEPVFRAVSIAVFLPLFGFACTLGAVLGVVFSNVH